MNVPTAIKLLLDRMNTRKQFVGGLSTGWFGTTGNISAQQRDMNSAISKWREQGDISGLRQVTTALHAYGNLTDTEYEQIMKALDGEE